MFQDGMISFGEVKCREPRVFLQTSLNLE